MENHGNRNGSEKIWSGFYDIGVSNSSYDHRFGGPSSSSSSVLVQQPRQIPVPPLQFHQNQNYHNHLTCLKLGKRPYCGEQEAAQGCHVAKRDKPTSPPPAVVPRCQVEGCNKSLLDSKDYHKRHKVCELHSKAPRVMVLGVEQRFCQQCSRFHVIAEFDDAKRSCRRRLAGHNERRRKSNTQESLIRSSVHSSLGGTVVGTRYPFIPTSPDHALSLLSSKAGSPWVSTPADLSSRSSAALRELIAENRAAILGRQLTHYSNMPHNLSHQLQVVSPPPFHYGAGGWAHFAGGDGQVTLDLMQAPGASSSFGRGNNESDDEDCNEIWKSLEGTHVV
ncbi:hypothetical protein LUZ60_016874 [Juncus effusus]|nr:hypothetical protein LUZ60_016874 [Juncus effusus]